MATNPARTHILIDLICPSRQKKKSEAITPLSRASVAAEIKCAYCQQPWEQELPGPVMAGPFPK